MKLAFKIDEAIFPPAGIYKGTTGVAKLASDIILILTGVAGILSFIFIIIGGIKIITAAGDEKKMASAQATITYAIIGLVVTALAFVILRVVQYFLRSNVP
ncbi:MAG: hypothetical protein AAB639_03605, partial [Patescibacteria group bacterium]